MAGLSSYASLKTSVLDWLARGDLVVMAPDFVRLLEARVNQELTLEAMLATATGALTDSQLTLPANWASSRVVYLGTAPQIPLQYRTPTQLLSLQEIGLPGETRYFTVIGNTLRFAPLPEATAAYGLIYYAQVPALSDAAPTNWLLATAPGVYLYGSLVEGSLYLQDDQAAIKWEALYQRAIAALSKSDIQSAYSGSLLAVRNL